MTIDSGQILEWGLLGGFLILLAYTMRVIKREKQVFLENPSSYYLRNFHFQTPGWWSATAKEVSYLKFERKDTRYDWSASFRWIDLVDNKLNARELFLKNVSAQNILFDKDVSIIHNPKGLSCHLNHDNEDWDIVRVEGTATRDAEDRLYYDAYLIKDKKNSGYLFCQSVSSVLNGLIEGPYFEEVVKRLKLTDSSWEKKV